MPASFLNDSNMPNGMRRNNPGNLRPLNGKELWEGEIRPGGKRPAFSIFQNMAYGLRGMITDVTGKIVNKKLNTLRKLINVYAPPFENNTRIYIDTVARATGLKPDQVIPVSKAMLDKIIRTKIQVEQGKKYAEMIPDEDFDLAYSMLSDKVKGWLKIPAKPASVFLSINSAFKQAGNAIKSQFND